MGKTKGFIEPKGSRRRVRVKTIGFIKPLALGGSKGLSSCAEGEGAEGWMPIYVLPASGRGFAFAKQGI